MSDFEQAIATLESQKAALRQPNGGPIFTPAIEAEKLQALTAAGEAAWRQHDASLRARQNEAVEKIKALTQPPQDPVYSLRGDDLARAASLKVFIEADIAAKSAAEIDQMLDALGDDRAALAVCARALAAAEPGSLVDAIGLTQLRQKALAVFVDKQATAHAERQTAELRRQIGEIAKQRAAAEQRYQALAGRSRRLVAM